MSEREKVSSVKSENKSLQPLTRRFTFSKITEKEVKRAITCSRAKGWIILNKLLKTAATIISSSLANIFNLSIKTCIFPED